MRLVRGLVSKFVGLRGSRLGVGAIAALSMLSAGQAAQAGFLQIGLQEAGFNGGAITLVASAADFTAVSYTGAYGDFQVNIAGGTSDNGGTASDLMASTTSVKNNAGTTKTLNIYITQSDYTLPVGSSLAVESGMGGSISIGSLNMTNLFQAFFGPGNALFGISSGTSGPQAGVQTGSSFDTGSAF